MKYIVILFIAFISFQCSPKLAPDAGWNNKRWVVVEMKGVPVQQSGSRRDAYLNFETTDKRFFGNGGCNQINGNYTIEKSTINFGEVISTRMSCEDIEFENVFIKTLGTVNKYEVNDTEMVLKNKREVVLRLRIK